MASLQRKGLQAKILTSEEKEKLKSEQALVSGFKQQKLENEAQKNWDLFYKRNSTNFFKDRHWTTREFEELKSCREFEGQKLTILEAGCGVGNCLFPLLEEDLSIFAYACDFSPRAVEYVKQNPLYNLERCKVFQCDLTKDDLLDHVPRESVDIVMLIFVLSAVHPDKMHLVLQNIYKVLKPGKSVLFRDYGLYDHTMLRFKASSKLGENFYVRQDGTRSYFFTEEFLAQLFVGTGYEEVVNEYVFRETVNKKEGLCVPRVFLQSKFRKPPRDLSPATLYHQSLQNNFFQDYVQVIEAALTSQPLFKKAHLIPVLGRRRIGITTRVVLDANILSLHCCLNYTHTVSIFIVIVEEGKYLFQMHFLGQLQLRSIFDYCRYKKVRVLLPNM